MGEESYDDDELELQYSAYVKQSKVAPEIVEIGEETDDDISSGVTTKGRDESNNSHDYNVYIAVGKDDLEVLRWALNNAVLPGARVNLIHVFPPISSIPSPVGRLWTNQLSPEQVKVYANENRNKRRHLLNKYIQLCVENKVNVDTTLIESRETTKAIQNLIPVLNMTCLIMGTKHTPSSRPLMKGSDKGMLVKRGAPEYCKVTIVYHGKKLHADERRMISPASSSILASNGKMSKVHHDQQASENNSMECRCFPVKFY